MTHNFPTPHGRSCIGRLRLCRLSPAAAMVCAGHPASMRAGASYAGNVLLLHGEVRPLYGRRLLFAAFQLVALLVCWWWDAFVTDVRTPVLRSVDEFCSTCGESCTLAAHSARASPAR